MTAIATAPLTAIDKSVRDHPQQVSIADGVITITSKVGRRVASTHTFMLYAWKDAERRYANEHSGRAEFMRERFAFLDDQPGGAGQAERIRDSMTKAIVKALGIFYLVGSPARN
jgi:hypothetical protein